MSTATALTHVPAKAPAWAVAMGRLNNYVMNDFGGGPRPWKLAWVINFQKLGTIPLLGAFIAWYPPQPGFTSPCNAPTDWSG
jgi:hypothetical protein